MSAARLAAVLIALVAGLRAQGPGAFERDVLPILRDRCFECHQAPQPDAAGRTKKPKGGLRLDGRAWILRGGDGGPVLEAGAPEDSELCVRIALPADDPDVMPSKGEPLSTAQIATLRAWVLGGAEFGDWQGAPGPDASTPEPADAPLPAAPPPAVRALQELAEGLAPVGAGAVARAEAAHAQVRSLLGDDRRLVRVAFPAHQEQVGDATLGALAPFREQIADLDLARTAIRDDALTEVARMRRLARLDLSRTTVGDAGVRRLRRLEHLRSLNLFGTAATDASIDTLAAMPALEVVYVWQSAISAAGVDRLRAARPTLRVVGAPDLPEPETGGDPPPRRRR